MSSVTKAIRIRFSDKELCLKFFHYDAGQLQQLGISLRHFRRKAGKFLADLVSSINAHLPSVDAIEIIDGVPFQYLGEMRVKEGRKRLLVKRWRCQLCGAVKEDPWPHADFERRNNRRSK